jgi:hypothetical protein
MGAVAYLGRDGRSRPPSRLLCDEPLVVLLRPIERTGRIDGAILGEGGGGGGGGAGGFELGLKWVGGGVRVSGGAWAHGCPLPPSCRERVGSVPSFLTSCEL